MVVGRREWERSGRVGSTNLPASPVRSAKTTDEAKTGRALLLPTEPVPFEVPPPFDEFLVDGRPATLLYVLVSVRHPTATGDSPLSHARNVIVTRTAFCRYFRVQMIKGSGKRAKRLGSLPTACCAYKASSLKCPRKVHWHA